MNSPFAFDILLEESCLTRYDHHIERRLSSLDGQYSDSDAYQRLLESGDPMIYEVYEISRPEVAGELRTGLSVVHPGRVGSEYFMTKGHFHSVIDTAETYYCVKGRGLLLMENVQGDWAAEELLPGRAVYVAPGWAHRSINTGDEEDLATLFTYPAEAGHDYGAIERQGFLKRVVSGDGGYRVIDNMDWLPPPAAKTRPTMYFLGVTTGKSSIMKVFPLWMKEIGREEVAIEGVDLQLHDDRRNYRRAVAQIKYDPLSLGALVTTHKVNLLVASRDMFDYLDPYAVTCAEVSSISKNGALLAGHAKDPVSSGLSLDSLLGKGYFGRTGGQVLCFGAGGSTAAIALHLAQKEDRADRPRRIIVVNRSAGRLDCLRQMVAGLHTAIEFEYHCNVLPEFNDELMGQLPPASLVINATGMGKDLPGSPITDRGLFPVGGVAWDLNYRGELQFLHQALAQRETRQVRVEDGWLYFLHGWTQVIAEVLKVRIDEPLFQRLAVVAGAVSRPVMPASTGGA
jgi:oxalate decarboxylase/phosphoglucose isomerase-like protein (cupin superfamily)/shikimate 5-dehydrogenase